MADIDKVVKVKENLGTQHGNSISFNGVLVLSAVLAWYTHEPTTWLTTTPYIAKNPAILKVKILAIFSV